MSKSKIVNMKDFVVNAMTRSLTTLFPNYGSDTKHQRFYADYGYPELITFEMCFNMWRRNGYATAGVNHAVETCWISYPLLVEREETHSITPIEQEYKDQFSRLKFWSHLSEADKYSRVGEYAGVIFRFRDSKKFDQPVDKVAGGINGLVEIIPVWQGQLKPLTFDDNELSENYGSVTMYQFNEADVQTTTGVSKRRQFQVHPDRVHIWSRTGTIYGTSVLEAGFNDLITIQKIIGAGGEGFWKNAKSAPILNVDKDTQIAKLAQMLGVPADEIADKMDEIVGDFNSGLDNTMMFQGIDVKFQAVDLPDPEKFLLGAEKSFAASVNEPLKLLVGNQNGERASTEDNKQWNKTCNSRIQNYIKPNVMAIIDRLVKYGILPNKKWFLLWPDLTESTTQEKIAIAKDMVVMNKDSQGSGMVIFQGDEIRETAGWEGSAEEVVLPRDKLIDKQTKEA